MCLHGDRDQRPAAPVLQACQQQRSPQPPSQPAPHASAGDSARPQRDQRGQADGGHTARQLEHHRHHAQSADGRDSNSAACAASNNAITRRRNLAWAAGRGLRHRRRTRRRRLTSCQQQGQRRQNRAGCNAAACRLEAVKNSSGQQWPTPSGGVASAETASRRSDQRPALADTAAAPSGSPRAAVPPAMTTGR